MTPLILIPTRMAATRLPGKPLADIGGKPMIVRAWEQAMKSGLPVAVAAGDPEIVDVVEAAGGRAVLTDPALPSGSDRVLAALDAIDPDGEYDSVINLQGDMPLADPGIATACAALLHGEPTCDIATLVAAESDVSDRTTSASTATAARPWSCSARRPRRRSKDARSWSSCARWSWACRSGRP